MLMLMLALFEQVLDPLLVYIQKEIKNKDEFSNLEQRGFDYGMKTDISQNLLHQ